MFVSASSQVRVLCLLSVVVVGMVRCGKKEIPADKAADGTKSPTATATAGTAASILLSNTLAISSDLTGIVVTSANTALQLNAGPSVKASKFYGLKPDGALEELKFFTKDDSSAADLEQGTALDVIQSELFNFFVFSSSPVDNCTLVLHRKSDSKLFCGGSYTANSGTLNTGNMPAIQTDSSGNVYFHESGAFPKNQIVKLNLANPESPTRTTVYEASGESNGGVSGFVVGPSGDVFVILGSGNGSALIKKSNGGIVNVAAASQVRAFIDKAGAFYWIKYGSDAVTKLTRAADGTYTSAIHGTGLGASVANLGIGSGGDVCETADDVFGGMTGNVTFGADVAHFINTPSMLNIAAQGFASWSQLRCGSDRVYVLGTDSSGSGLIKSYLTSSATWQTVVPAGDYTIYNFDVDSSGALLFTGLRNSNGALVLAKLPVTGSTIEVVSENFFRPEKLKTLN